MASQQDAPATVMAAVGTNPITADVAMVTPESVQTVARDFEARPGDVMIVTFPKCGTTWCQQLCHQLRTGGHTDFEEISEERIVPWLEVSPGLGIDTALPQLAEPRCFKTHQLLSALSCFEAGGAKYLCVLRDPEATLLSQFKFWVATGEPSAASKDVNVFATASFVPATAGGSGEFPPAFGGYLYDFIVEFWRCRAMPHVRLLVFEHLKRDLGSQIPVIAEFMGLDLDGALHAKVAELGSFAWMAAHDHLFDDHYMETRIAQAKGKGESKEEVSSVTATKVGLEVGDDVNTKVAEETRALLARAWQEVVTPVTGHATYQAMIAELEQSRS